MVLETSDMIFNLFRSRISKHLTSTFPTSHVTFTVLFTIAATSQLTLFQDIKHLTIVPETIFKKDVVFKMSETHSAGSMPNHSTKSTYKMAKLVSCFPQKLGFQLQAYPRSVLLYSEAT
jgi:hypothetical protein